MAVKSSGRRLHVVHGTPAPAGGAHVMRQRVKAMPKPPCMISCHRCGGREVVRTLFGVMLKDGKPVGGQKALLCLLCLLKGDRVELD